MIIDAYAHAYHGNYLSALERIGGDWIKQGILQIRNVAQSKPDYIDIALRLSHLDKYNIDLQVVTTGPRLDSSLCPGDTQMQLAVARAVNDNMARIMDDSKGRLISAATVPIRCFEQGGFQEMKRALKKLGLRAVCLPSNIEGKALDSVEFEPFWAEAAAMDTAVYIHPYRVAGHCKFSYEAEYDIPHNFGFPYETTVMLSRFVFSGMLERYPTLKIVTHHLGGMIPFFLGRTIETYDPSKQQSKIGKSLPKQLIDYFSRFYYDTAVGGSAPAIKCAYEVFGAGQIVFATDYPMGPGSGENRLANYPKVIKSLRLPKEHNKMIFEDNARKILGLKKATNLEEKSVQPRVTK